MACVSGFAGHVVDYAVFHAIRQPQTSNPFIFYQDGQQGRSS